jgi:hypothetical protein
MSTHQGQEMLYTLSEAAKATGLDESFILGAIETGRVAGSKDLHREWRIDDEELHRLYLSVAQDYCKRQYRSEVGQNTERSAEPGQENITDGHERTAHNNTFDPASNSSTGAALEETRVAATWKAKIKVDDRDKIFAPDHRLAVHRTRTAFIRRASVVTLACIGAMGCFYVFGQSLMPQQKVNPSAHIPGSETEKASITPLVARSEDERIRSVPAVSANAIGDPRETRPSAAQAPSALGAITKQDPKASHASTDKSQKQVGTNPMPVPETRPTTVKGWTLLSVIAGIATLQGPSGTLKVARGDTVPGLGRVDSIVMWGSRWIVSTSGGLVTTP